MSKPLKLHEPTEHRIQAMLVSYLKLVGVNACWFAVPNGASWSAATANRMKAEGFLPGVADLVFIGPGGKAHFLEMKRPRGIQSDAQVVFANKAQSMGAEYALARSFEEALDVLRGWGLIR